MYEVDEVIPRTETEQEHFAYLKSEGVCAGCYFVSKGRYKDTFRLWSVVYCEDGGLADHYPSVYDQWGEDVSYSVRLKDTVQQCDDRIQITCRGDLSEAARLMMDPPDCKWFASIADSGQKQVLRHATVNIGDDYVVRYEMRDVHTDAETMRRLYYHASTLKSEGWSSEDILTGQPSQSKMYKMADKLPTFWHNIEKISDKIESKELELALFTLTEEVTSDIRQQAKRLYEGPTPDAGGGQVHPAASILCPEGPDRSEEILGLGAESTSNRGGPGADVRKDAIGSLPTATDEGSGDTEEAKQKSLFNR
jgi:hypothetical protein